MSPCECYTRPRKIVNWVQWEEHLKVRVLGAFGSEGLGQRPSAFLVDDRVLIDAGTVGGALTVPEQIEIQHAVISHAHLDHTAGIAFLADTLAMVAPERHVTVSSIAPKKRNLPDAGLNGDPYCPLRHPL